MKIILVVLASVFSANCMSQNFEWAIQLSGLNSDRIRNVSINSFNEILVTGYFSGTVDFDPGPGTFALSTTYSSTAFAAKYDSSNGLLWAVKFEGSTGSTYGYACGFDSQNNAILAGNMSGIVDFDPGTSTSNLSSVGGIDAYVVKLDNNGNYLWARTFGSAGIEEIYSVGTDENNNIYLGGYNTGTVDFDPGPGVYNQTAGGFICKLNTNGNFKWASRFASTEVRSVKSQGGYVVSTGNFNGSVDFNPGTGSFVLSGTTDIYVLQLDTLNSFNWAFKIVGNDALDIEFDSNNNIYCNGYFGGTYDFDPGPGTYNLSASGSNLASYLLKLTALGNFIYAFCLTGTGSCTGIDIAVDENKNVYSTGIFYNTVDFDPGAGIQNLTSNGNEEIYICKTDSVGNLVWVRSIGSTGWDAGYGIDIDGNSSLYIGGSFQNTVDFNTDTATLNLTAQGNHDGFLLKLNQLNCNDFTILIDSALNCDCSASGYASCSVLNQNGTVNYTWNSIPASSNNFMLPTISGIYTVIATDSINCVMERSVLINGPVSLSGTDFDINLIETDFIPGVETSIMVHGTNDACTPSSGTITVILDTILSFSSSIPIPDLISGDTLKWNFNGLYYNSIPFVPEIFVITDTNVDFNDSLSISVAISPISGDLDTSNNRKIYHFNVSDSYDPNDKHVYPQGECIPNYTLNQQPLTYTIRFQNTGNADAINIHILDTLDPNLDLNTLRVIGNSHYLITEILPGNVMNFRFDNIHLPDSGTNELLSHGYVIYEVSPMVGTPDYTLINNTSHIYFDFNPAIITNTTFNTLVDSIPSYTTTENVSVCYNSEYTLPDGTVLSNIISPVLHQSNLWMVDGCDSTIFTNITILPIIDTGVTLNGFTVSANAAGLNYQWINCNSGLPIAGQNSIAFSPSFDGDYAVIISDNNCSDTSACISVTGLGVSDYAGWEILLFPNPAQNEITVSNYGENTTIEIYNLEGQLLKSVYTYSLSTTISLNDLASGIYFVKVNSEMGTANFKLIKE